MKRIVIVLAILAPLAAANVSSAADYQKVADETQWSWSEEHASVVDSFVRFPKDYQIELIRKQGGYDFAVRLSIDGKELVAWNAHSNSVFAMHNAVLVYAVFTPTATGCHLVAFDLKKQKMLWQTKLKGLGPIDHFDYSNSVNLAIIDDNVLQVFGNESAGQYLEFVDLKTGKTVGHRRYERKR